MDLRASVVWLASLGAAGPALALGAPDTPACREALAALQAQEAALPATPRGTPAAPPAALVAARRQAAQACLGAGADIAPPRTQAQLPQAVPPVSVAPPARPPRSGPEAPPAALPPTPQRPAPPQVVTACDPLGCWASDGTRLQRTGPQQLLGPRGYCSVQGTVLQCP